MRIRYNAPDRPDAATVAQAVHAGSDLSRFWVRPEDQSRGTDSDYGLRSVTETDDGWLLFDCYLIDGSAKHRDLVTDALGDLLDTMIDGLLDWQPDY
jgi:hypothetical protein